MLLEGLDNDNPLISVEKISDEEAAFKRLDHNSYDVLLLEDGFVKNTLDLPIMAYAMTRPSIIICKSIFKLLYYYCWRFFSRFSRNFKLSKILINFAMKDDEAYLKQQIIHLAYNHLHLYDAVNAEVTENTLKNV